ncbi:helix-turn-helix domain-containing protein [Sodalis sp. (in: enterobacteria)]|uniref:helix-turn-helix domain-containing protein n=1 Tax=Sodalis sp. (in: enterobacteria) TaxID=1898979 RepID=UPI0039E503EA
MSQKEDQYVDWHPEIIKAEIHKRGLSLRALSLEAGYSKDSLKTILRTPCRPYQQIIANALG